MCHWVNADLFQKDELAKHKIIAKASQDGLKR